MTERTVQVRLPKELLDFVDMIRFGEVARIGQQWTTIPASQGEVLEMLAWKAHAAFFGD